MTLNKPKFASIIKTAGYKTAVLAIVILNILMPSSAKAAAGLTDENDKPLSLAIFTEILPDNAKDAVNAVRMKPEITPVTPTVTKVTKTAKVAVITKTVAEATPTDVDNDGQVETPDKVVKAVLTAYSSTPDQCDDDPFTAASGKHVYDGMVAANWLPFGTKIKIPALFGDKIFTVDDRMNSRYGYGRMDIWFNTSRTEVNKFGVKRTDIEIYYKDSKVVINK